MTVVVLSPHQDDGELFCSYQIIRESAYVVVCLRSVIQEQRATGITHDQRLRETEAALAELGCDAWEQWTHPDDQPNIFSLAQDMIHLDLRLQPKRVYAPAVESGGHEQHNLIAEAAMHVFGPRMRHYMTYVRGGSRSRGGVEVLPKPKERKRKRAALDCHRSQIELENTRFWFSDESEWWREWLA